jgi:Clostripain family
MAKAPEREWTLMFYFASDNPLAPGILSQLKTIKQAGFHHDVNVIAQFDPQPEGTPTHIFDVNNVRKLKIAEDRIGFIGFNERDPFVTNLVEDKLWREETGGENDRQKDRNGTAIRKRIRDSLEEFGLYDPPEPPLDRKPVEKPAAAGLPKKDGDASIGETRELNPNESLEAFLHFCAESYPARHYMLFILGHGVVVGNDIFLFDENADEQSLSLKDLGKLLSDFRTEIDKKGYELELVSFHSCSVSSVEVAYELQLDTVTKGAANYMLASQGPAFVGSWPYRQILMSIFNNVAELKTYEDQKEDGKTRDNIRELVRDIFSYCFYNSTDFLAAGYSFDLCLCDLNKVAGLNASLVALSKALQAGLKDEDEQIEDDEKRDDLFKGLVALAHWKAQSQWQENYTDLSDFCFCLSGQCGRFLGRLGADPKAVLGERRTKKLEDIAGACDAVRSLLRKEDSGGGGIIVESEFAGPEHQYSNGLSVFFPWSRPVSDRPILEEYEQYKFNTALAAVEKESTWFKFLETYFEATKRRPRKLEVDKAAGPGVVASRELNKEQQDKAELAEDLLSLVFNDEGRLSLDPSTADVLKIGTRDPTGDECTCGSIKNYPRDTRALTEKAQQAGANGQAVPASQTTVKINKPATENATREFSIAP